MPAKAGIQTGGGGRALDFRFSRAWQVGFDRDGHRSIRVEAQAKRLQLRSPRPFASGMLSRRQRSVEAMAKATGEVVECPTQELPFMAVISTEGKIIQERFFASRPEAEAFLVVTLKELAKTDAQGKTKAPPRKANARGKVIETPTQDMPFKAVISTEGKIVQERFFASRPEAEAFVVDTLKGLSKTAKRA
jgi:O-acetyl-ADP-ribose deacetylase (regulator of RNase III)